MDWKRILTGGCPNCESTLTTSNFMRRVYYCEDQDNCGLEMLPWEHAAILTGMKKGYHEPSYKVVFGDDPLVLEWLQHAPAARARFLREPEGIKPIDPDHA